MSSTPPSTFHQFPHLPAELQIEIWEYFALDALEPRVHFRKLCYAGYPASKPFVMVESTHDPPRRGQELPRFFLPRSSKK
ncbi:hypothetical protein QBC38DRAFT_461374 [Podospora fimiseda]|uniref:2EXR domain-containing protein n=1 Tax=Podospora fimiseda TaxID=252190 RepID=A0AAN6YRN3_9PEZI|nr:hypothetical protein QBC38DRAFT_461374 [Podospora fimiseda]